MESVQKERIAGIAIERCICTSKMCYVSEGVVGAKKEQIKLNVDVLQHSRTNDFGA